MVDEIKKMQFINAVKVVVIGAACIAAAPIVIFGSLGLVGMLLAGGIGVLGINVAPVVALKLANWKYRAMDAERVEHINKVQDAAAENPIETLQLEYNERVKATERFAQGITEFRTEIKNYSDQVKQFETEYPEDAHTFRDQLAAMKENLESREAKFKTVRDELVKFDNTIKRMRAMWKMAQATQKMNKLAGMNTGDEFARIKTEAAVDSVMSSVNKAFAEMETEVMVNKKTSVVTITHNPSPTLQLPTQVDSMETIMARNSAK